MTRERDGELRVNSWRAFLVLAGFFLVAAMSNSVAAQSTAPPAAPNPSAPATLAPAQDSGAPPANAQAAKGNSSGPATPKKHKVFTDDDVPALRAKGGIANDDDAGEAMIYGTMGACDAECEQEVKEQLGVTPEQEGEWKLQMTAARREIGEDRQWREIYGKGQQAMKWVCAVRTQEETVPAPSGNDYQSRLERAKQQKMFADAEQASVRQLQNVVAGMNQYIAPFSWREPVRAVMMRDIGERLVSGCPDTDP